MSDLIERLRCEGYTIGGWDDALSEIEAQQAEIARLFGLVEEAYWEGFMDGKFTDSSEAWSVSDTRRTLEQRQ